MMKELMQKKIDSLVLFFKKNSNQNRRNILKIFLKTYYLSVKNYFFSIIFDFKRSKEFTKKRYNRIWSIDKIHEMYSLNGPENIRLYKYKKVFFTAPEALMSRVYQTIHAEFVIQLKPDSVLEVGCGQGFHLKLLSSLFPKKKFYGIDQSKSGIEFAKNKIKSLVLTDEITLPLEYKYSKIFNNNLVYSVQDATKLSFSNNSIDMIYTNLALEQMDDIKYDVLNEIKRVAKNYILLIEPFKNLNNIGAKFFHHRSKKYFSLNTNDLEDKKFKITSIIDNIPGYINLGVAGLLLKRR